MYLDMVMEFFEKANNLYQVRATYFNEKGEELGRRIYDDVTLAVGANMARAGYLSTKARLGDMSAHSDNLPGHEGQQLLPGIDS